MHDELRRLQNAVQEAQRLSEQGGRYAEAKALLLQALTTLEPKNEVAWEELAEVAKRAGRQDLAREASVALLALRSQRQRRDLPSWPNGVHARA